MRWTDAPDPRTWSLYAIAIGFASGLLLRSFFVIADTMSLVVAGTLSGLFLAIGILRRRKSGWRYTACGLFILGALLGMFRMHATQLSYDQEALTLAPYIGVKTEVEGRVVSDVEAGETARIFIMETDAVGGVPMKTRVEVRAYSASALSYGDTVALTGKLDVPKSFETELGRTFPYPEYLRARGVMAKMLYVEIELREKGTWWNLRRLLFDFKHRFIDSIDLLVPEPASGLAKGLVLGVRHTLPDSLEEAFRVVGIVHIIVLSGYNLTVVAEFVMKLLSRVLTPRPRLFVGGVSILLFALMVGLSATVVRASLMAVLVLVARATGNVYGALRALFVAGLIMIVWNPYVLAFDPGFQLSFLATLGLILCSPVVERSLLRVPSRFGMREFLVTTLATQIFVAPFLMYSMGNVSLVFLLANALVLTIVPLTMLCVAVAGFAGIFLGIYALPLAYVPYLLLSYIVAVAEYVSRIPYASLSIPPFSFVYVALTYAVLGALLFVLHKKTPIRKTAYGSSLFGS